MKLTRKDLYLLTALLAAGAVLFGFNLGGYGLLDPTEPFYGLSAKEMLDRRDPLVPRLFGMPQFEKPIFFYWVLYTSFHWLGVSEFSARIGSCLAGILTVFVTYFWGRVLFGSRRPAFLSALFLATAAEFIVLSRTAFTDIFLCLFVTSAFFSFSFGYARPDRRAAAWTLFFFFCGLGFLTKGPLGLVLPLGGVLAFLLLSGESKLLREVPWKRGLLVFGLTALPWYALMAARYPGFLSDFFVHENVRRIFVAEHRGMDRPYFYPLGFALGLFPWTALFPAALFFAARRAKKPGAPGRSFFFLLAAFFVPFFVLSLAKSKLLSYIFPVFPPAALLIGGWLDRALSALDRDARPRWALLGSAAFVWGVFPVGLAAAAFAYCRSRGLDGLEAPVTAIAAAFVPLCWAGLFFAARGRYRAAFASILAAVFAFAGVGFGWLMPEADAYFSSRPAGQTYRRFAAPEGLLLSSKMFVRGVSYYADADRIGVVAEFPEKVFYTKHPLPFFSKPEDLASLPDDAFPLYAVLRKKELDFLARITDGMFEVETVEKDGPKSLVRISKK